MRGGVGEKQLMSGRKHNYSTTCQYSRVINILVASVKGLLVITHFLLAYKPLDLIAWKERCAISRVNEGKCKLMTKSRYRLFCISDATQFFLNVLRRHCWFSDLFVFPAVVPVLSVSSMSIQKFLKFHWWIKHWILPDLTRCIVLFSSVTLNASISLGEVILNIHILNWLFNCTFTAYIECILWKISPVPIMDCYFLRGKADQCYGRSPPFSAVKLTETLSGFHSNMDNGWLIKNSLWGLLKPLSDFKGVKLKHNFLFDQALKKWVINAIIQFTVWVLCPDKWCKVKWNGFAVRKLFWSRAELRYPLSQFVP